jgi:hypothetical protein
MKKTWKQKIMVFHERGYKTIKLFDELIIFEGGSIFAFIFSSVFWINSRDQEMAQSPDK